MKPLSGILSSRTLRNGLLLKTAKWAASYQPDYQTSTDRHNETLKVSLVKLKQLFLQAKANGCAQTEQISLFRKCWETGNSYKITARPTGTERWQKLSSQRHRLISITVSFIAVKCERVFEYNKPPRLQHIKYTRRSCDPKFALHECPNRNLPLRFSPLISLAADMSANRQAF